MLKYLITGTRDLIVCAVLLGMLFGYLPAAYGQRGRRFLNWGALLGLLAAAVMAYLKNKTKLIDTGWWNLRIFTVSIAAWLLMAGLGAAGGQFAITAAYTYAPSREISVYDYSNIVFVAIEGYLFLGHQIPDILSIVGYITICLMAVWMFIYNNKEAKLEKR